MTDNDTVWSSSQKRVRRRGLRLPSGLNRNDARKFVKQVETVPCPRESQRLTEWHDPVDAAAGEGGDEVVEGGHGEAVLAERLVLALDRRGELGERADGDVTDGAGAEPVPLEVVDA